MSLRVARWRSRFGEDLLDALGSENTLEPDAELRTIGGTYSLTQFVGELYKLLAEQLDEHFLLAFLAGGERCQADVLGAGLDQ